jgi:hypothetical protein
MPKLKELLLTAAYIGLVFIILAVTAHLVKSCDVTVIPPGP